MSWRALLAMAVLVGICLACLAALDSVSRSMRDRAAVVLPPIDYVLDNVRLVRHRAGGVGRVEIRAERVIHHRESEELDVRAPELRRLGGDEATLTATAERARVHKGNDQIDLSGGVQLERVTGERSMLLNTETLEVRVEAQTARTDDPVKITEGASIIDGRGLDADLSAARYQILADLKARYVQVPRTKRPAAAAAGLPQPVAAASISPEN